MDKWANALPKDREALFTETAAKKDISPEIVEKDFWVCWTLLQISRLTDLPRLIFKGGTSLSKAFGIIKRFSEDIDLVINRHELGFNDKTDPANQEATNLRNRTIEKLKETCFAVIAKEFAPKLQSQASSIIGDHGWTLRIDPNAPEPDTVEFEYPKGLPDSQISGYIRRAVRLELGCRGDQIPCEEATLTPYAAEAFPDQFQVRSVKVNAIGPERTFWEKATILHREYYRAEAGKPVTERVFRHYHDVVIISNHPRGLRALGDLNLLEQLVEHKQHFSGRAVRDLNSLRRELSALRPAPSSKRSSAGTTRKCEKCTLAGNPISMP